MRSKLLVGVVLLLIALMPGMPALADVMPQGSSTDSTDEAVKASVLEAYAKLPLLFIENQGQLDGKVEYYVKASGQTLYFTHENIVFDLIRYQEGTEETDSAQREAERLVYSLDFLGANKKPGY